MSERPSPWLVPLLHVPTYLGLSLMWMVAVGVGTAAVLLVTHGLQAANPDAIQELLGAGGMGVLSILQIAGLAALAMALTATLPASTDQLYRVPGPGVLHSWRTHLALRSARWPWIAAAGLGALTVWTVPSLLAEHLIDLLPEGSSSSLELLSNLLRDAPLGGRTVLIVAIVISAPIFEEVIFRGYLWAAIEHAAPGWVAWIVTSLCFALYHLDPVHTVALLPTALFLGWLRWMSGSLAPCVLAHFVNNALAAVLTIWPTQAHEDPTSLPVWAALLGGVSTLACAAAAWAIHRRGEAR